MNMSEQQHIVPTRGTTALMGGIADEFLAKIKYNNGVFSHKNMQLVQNKSQFEKARQIASTLGFRCAARYLAIRGYSIECAMWELCGKEIN
jgi:hypothetical protein